MTTPDEHLKELTSLLKYTESYARDMKRSQSSRERSQRTADAIRWLLSETAYPIEENTPT